MLIKGYGLGEFVHDMDVFLDTGADQENIFAKGAAWLERLIQNPECIAPEYQVPVGKGPLRSDAPCWRCNLLTMNGATLCRKV